MNASATSRSEQVEAIVKVVEGPALGNAVRRVLEKFDSGAHQRVLAQGNSLVLHLVATLETKLVELATMVVGFLKLISGSDKIMIAATDGKGTIASSKDVFPGWLDPDFKNYGTDVKGKPTDETTVQVFEMIKDGTFAQIFGGFGENLDRLCLSQDQIIRFVTDQVNWLRTDGYGTFFLFKVNGEFFVASVFRDEGRLKVNARSLSNDYVWRAERRRRIVVPQL